jgi:regulator of cell morphogenesis and NO signaling
MKYLTIGGNEMENGQAHCGMMGNESVALSRPLQTLKDEHVLLRAQMEDLYESSIAVTKGEESSYNDNILQLREKVISFVSELDPHSEREEGVLFPMMGLYIGMGNRTHCCDGI